MKPFHLLFLLLSFTVLYVQAQRRTTSTTTESPRAASSRSPVRSRGRSRFTLTEEFKESHELSSTIEPTFKHISPRKRVSDFSISRESKSKPQSAKNNYEVQEIVNESPIDSFKRQSKPRVLTENVFETSSTPRLTSSEEISSKNESIKATEAQLAETSILSTEEAYTASNSENIETPSAEFSSESQEISRTQPISTTQVSTKSSRRPNGRRSGASEEVTTFSSRSRARSRASESAPAPRSTRIPKRKTESSTLLADASRRGPSVFDAPQTDLRSRPGRRIDTVSTERSSGRTSVSSTERSRSRSGRRLETLRPEKITLDIPKEHPSRSKSFQSRNSGGQIRNREVTTVPSRGGKFRSRTTTPLIDEQKLEVLPLFESEPKTVQPPTRGRSRTKERRDSENEVVTIKPSIRSGRRKHLKSDTEDPMQVSSTETDIQFQKPEVSSQVTVSVATRTEPSTRRRNPQIKESVVISEVSEVTSKKVVTRRKNTATNEVGEKVKFIGKIVPRGKKKSEVKLNEVKRKSDDSEEVDESDNYPEPFKALIQSKKSKKESRSSASTSPSERLKSSSPTTAPVVVTSIVTSSSSASAEVTKEYHDLDNELVPRVAPTTFKPTSRPIRNRFSLTTKIPDTTPLDTDSKTKSPSRKLHRSRTTTQSPSTSSFSSRESRGPTTYTPRASSTNLYPSRESRVSSTASPETTKSPSTSSFSSRESRGPTTYASRSSSTTSYPSRESRLSSTTPPSTSTASRAYSTTGAHNRGSRFSSTTPAVVRVYPTPSYPSKESKTPSSTTFDVVRISSTTPYPTRETSIFSTSTSSPVYSTGRDSKSQGYSSRENKISTPTSFPNRQSTSYFPNRNPFSTTFSTSEYYEPSLPSTTSFSSREVNSLPDRGTKLFSPNSFNSENGPLVSTFFDRGAILPGRGTKLLSDTVPIKPSRNTSKERYSGRKKEDRGSRERSNKSVEEPILLSTKIPKSAFVPKKPSDRYRSDLSLRTVVTRTTTNAPAYIPTIPSAPYVPTVPTVTPPTRTAWKTSTVPSKRSTKDVDLGLEVLFFDDPVNSIQSANLVKGDYASSKENLLNNPTTPVKGGTTEKAVSIIERIINSIAANITSPSPFTPKQGSTSTTTTTESSKSAILKLATKKTKTDNDTDSTDKPTTIIEKILNSLSAIQATDDTNSVQVGKDFNTISSSSTTPLPTKPFRSLDSHHQSTSINPLSVLDEITPDQALEKRTIGTLLDILNGIKSHKKDDVVLVTPKRPYVNSQSTTAVIPISAFLSRPQGTTTSTSTTTTTTLSTNTPEMASETITPSGGTTETLVTESSTTIETTTLPMSTVSSTETTTPATTITTQSTTVMTEPTNSLTTERRLLHPHRFEVSPASVRIISANDFYTVQPDDNSLTTVTIASRTTYDNLGTTISSTSTTEEDGTTTTVLPEVTTMMEVGTTLETTTVQDPTTIMPPNTTDSPPPSNRSGKLLNSIQDPVSNSIDVSSSTTSTTPDYFIFAVLNNNTVLRKRPPTVPNKDTPFVIVGVYPNNTIIRKFPNGTVVPMDPIVRVSGFDTRDPPPPLPEITSNQVTGPTEDSKAPMGEQTTASIDTNNLPLETDAGWYTAFQADSNTERGGTTEPINTSKALENVYRIPPRKSKSYTSENNEIKRNNGPSTISANIFNSILQGVGTASTEGSRFPEISIDVGSGTTTISSVVQIPESISTTLGGFWGGNVGVDGTTSSTTTTAASTTTTANYRIIPFNKVEMTTRLNTPEISTSTTTTKAPMSTTTPVPKVPPTKPAIPQTPFVEEIITVPSISVDMSTSTSTAVPTTMSTLTTKAATTMTSTSEATTTVKSTTGTATTTTATTTTPKPTTSKTPSVRFISTTQRYTSTPTVVPRPTTTSVPSYFPTFLTTFFPNLFTPEPTRAPKYTTKATTSEVLSFAASTSQPSTVAAAPPRKRTTARTTAEPSKKRRTTTTTTSTTTTTTPTTTTTRKTTTTEKVVEVQSSTKRSVDLTDLNTISVTAKPTKKKLTPEQKRNLETLMQLEKEQAALLQQLSFLTTLNFGGNNRGAASALSNTNLASRIAQLTSESSKSTTSSTKSPSTTKKTTKQPHSIQDQLAALGVTTLKPSRNTPSLEDILKQYDLDGMELTTKAPAAKYGTSSDAILASILKEQGIAPPTPKSLAEQIEHAGVFEDATTKRPRPRPRTTAAPPRPRGGLLNWLLNAFAPPPSAPPPRRTKPKPKPKPTKPKKPPVEQELLANSPTHVTPIVTTAPKAPSPNSLSQDDIQKLIKQLEGLQKDPKGQLDLSQVKSLQTLINTDGPGVEVRTNGEHGATSHKPSTTRRPRARKTTTTTPEPLLSVAEEDEDDDEFSNAVSTPRSNVRGHTVAPLGFNPVPGVDEDGPGRMIRSNLLTAAVNVTRAMAGFLGTAIQGAARGAAQGFQSLLGSGSRLATSYAQGSSAGLG